MEEKLEALTRKLEEQQVINKQQQFRSYFNQPDFFSISSKNATVDNVLNSPTVNDSFFRFVVDLPRNILEPKGIQLQGVNFPQANATSFNDVELIFYYYRLKTQNSYNVFDDNVVYSEIPSASNMYIVRLLPSYYKQELIPDASLFGFNKTFNSYKELSDELAKACLNDLAVRNLSSTMPFIPGDITLSYNESLNKFQMQGNNTTTAWTPDEWVEGITYQQNNIVRRLGVNYISLTNNNTTTPTPTPTINAWVTSPQVYLPLDIVSYLGVNYVCKYENNGIPPSGDVNSATYWIPLVWSASYDYSNIRPSYPTGWIVTYAGLYYTNISSGANLNKQPNLNIGTFWEFGGDWEVYTGDFGFAYLAAGYEDPNIPIVTEIVNQESSFWDWLYALYGKPSILGIPPQPKTINGLTLNRRLGAGWNGLYTNFPTVVATDFSDTSYFPLLFNRIRPIPTYEIIPPEPELGTIPVPNNNPYTQSIYVFDGYCNLVYSSILYIYSDIGFSSSLTSEDTTLSLLSSVSLNCGSLGVAFEKASLDNLLLKTNSSLERILIELRDERNLPYYCGNNSIITLSFKVQY